MSWKGLGADRPLVRRERSEGREVSDRLYGPVGEKSIDFLGKLYRLFGENSIDFSPIPPYNRSDSMEATICFYGRNGLFSLY